MNMNLNRLNLNTNNKALKRTVLIISWLGISFLIILVIVIFLWQFRTNSTLRRDLSAKKKAVKQVQQANRRFEELKKQSGELKQEEELLDKRLPVGEKQPMGLIRQITLLAREKGLGKINFRIKSASALQEGTNPAVDSGKDLIPLYFEMSFETTFPQLLEFLKELADLERVITVEKLVIIREEGILPKQKINLSLVTYTFQAGDNIPGP